MGNTEKYIGVTMGPIVETMSLSSKPACLWCASYLFSSLARGIYLYLIKTAGVAREDIITPYYPKADEPEMEACFADGVGIHHDRLIVRHVEGREAVVNKAVENAVSGLAGKLAGNFADADGWKRYLIEYFQVYTVIVEIEKDGTGSPVSNPLLEVSKYLDAVELQKRFVSKRKTSGERLVEEDGSVVTVDLLKRLLAANDKSVNDTIKKIATGENGFGINEKGWQLTVRKEKSAAVRDIESIADGCPAQVGKDRRKYQSYYAFVQADGDNMGTLLKNMGGNTEYVQKFSTACISYARKAAELIKNYGGLTIFAGGDDLCFLAPVISFDEKTGKNSSILQLIHDLQNEFDEAFKFFIDDAEKDERPSLSFGVFISYYRFPLYEAYQAAIDLLFGTAKSVTGKNAVAIKVRKHSGQQFGVVFSKTREQFKNDNSPLSRIKTMMEGENDAEFISSVREHLRLYRPLFKNVLDSDSDDIFRNIFDNIFDSDVQRKFRPYIENVRELLKATHRTEGGMTTMQSLDKDDIQYAAMFDLDSAMSLIRFISEKGTEKGDDNNGSAKEGKA